MSDKRTSQEAAKASEQLQGRACGYSPMHQEIEDLLPTILTANEWAEMTGFPESQYPCSR